jgi:hypothetical protein
LQEHFQIFLLVPSFRVGARDEARNVHCRDKRLTDVYDAHVLKPLLV